MFRPLNDEYDPQDDLFDDYQEDRELDFDNIPTDRDEYEREEREDLLDNEREW